VFGHRLLRMCNRHEKAKRVACPGAFPPGLKRRRYKGGGGGGHSSHSSLVRRRSTRRRMKRMADTFMAHTLRNSPESRMAHIARWIGQASATSISLVIVPRSPS